MIISKTPFRVSFFGGGTDIKEYFSEHAGAVISTTIDKYCYVIVRYLPKFFDYSNEFVYSNIERTSNQEEIKHPLIKNTLKYLDVNNIRLSYEADLPARSGLGTSSAFAVGMLNALHSLKNENVDKKKLADEAIHIERVMCNELGGWQDQIATSYGGFNRIDFTKDSYKVTPIKISDSRKKELCSNLLMFFTGFTRFSTNLHKENKVSNKTNCLDEMYKLVNDAQEILENDSISLDDFGILLDKSWKLKKLTGPSITNSKIDKIYETGIKHGALGGKLLGAGGGGFILFYVKKENRQKVINALSDLLYVPFEFENNGSQIIYNSTNASLEKR